MTGEVIFLLMFILMALPIVLLTAYGIYQLHLLEKERKEWKE